MMMMMKMMMMMMMMMMMTMMLPIPAPEPATPTVAAPAPMNLAGERWLINVPGHGRGLQGTDSVGRDQRLFVLLGQQSVAHWSQVHLRSWGQSGTGNWGDNPGTVHLGFDFSWEL